MKVRTPVVALIVNSAASAPPDNAVGTGVTFRIGGGHRCNGGRILGDRDRGRRAAAIAGDDWPFIGVGDGDGDGLIVCSAGGTGSHDTS